MGDCGGVPVTRVLPGERDPGGRRPRVWLAATGIALVVLVAKPWGDAPEAPGPSPAAEGRPVLRPSASIQRATPTAEPPATLVEGICGRPVGWRIAAVERWAGRMARTLTALDVVTGASGPADRAIPSVRLAGVPVLALGYCVPATGADDPPAGTSATVWRLGEHGPVAVSPRVLERGGEDGRGLLWLPPPMPSVAEPVPVTKAAGWPPGRYVVRLADPASGYERWFGAEVDDPAAAGAAGP